MSNKKQLTSRAGNYLLIAISSLIIAPFTFFVGMMFISIIIAPFRPEPIDLSQLPGAFLLGITIMLFPLYLLSIICRMPQIYISDSGFYFHNQKIPWKEVEKITIFLGNSVRFTIKYQIENKQKKVFGALLFNRNNIVDALQGIAKEQSIPLSKWWI